MSSLLGCYTVLWGFIYKTKSKCEHKTKKIVQRVKNEDVDCFKCGQTGYRYKTCYMMYMT